MELPGKSKIVLIGPPASGKGTQAELLHERFGMPTCSTGMVLRAEVAAGSALGKRAEDYLSRGELLPDELMLEVVEGWIAEHREAFILDGFPRTVAQAEAFDRLLEGWGMAVDCAVYLDVAEEVLEERILRRVQCEGCRRIYRLGGSVGSAGDDCPRCGGRLVRRGDDNEETLRARLVEYGEKTWPLVAYYEEAGKIVTINGARDPEIVFKDIVLALA